MKIHEPILRDILDLQAILLNEIIDEAAAAERNLADAFGETTRTEGDLNALVSIREEAQDSYRRMSSLMSNIASSPARTAVDSMRLLRQAYLRTGERIAPAIRSIQEVKIAWQLP
ncbi:hypothetical protein [Gloeobacter violaceus]|uniref:hypothetical protein n=1 Tax=Gloeobacter violaceus TaxID=33072 RepID=UPI0013E8A0D6|nr:hypothetical protein [Gloeobacter violaceus]